jgi:hypothetical protein
VAVGDINGDGMPDIITVNNSLDSTKAQVGIQLGVAGGGYAAAQYFSAQVAGGSAFRNFVAVALGSVAGGTLPDIIIVDQTDSEVGFLQNNTTPDTTTLAFTPEAPVAVGNTPTSVAVGHFTSSGHLDLAVGHKGGGGGVSILVGNGDFTFSAPAEFATGLNVTAVTAADFNGDGNLDLVATDDSNPGQVAVLLGDGSGNFASGGVYNSGVVNPDSVAVGDFNNDGYPDIVVASRSTGATNGGVAVLLNQGGAGFGQAIQTNLLPGTGLASVVAANVNQDGFPDVVVSTLSSTITGASAQNLYTLDGVGDGTFNDVTPFQAASTGSLVAPSPSILAVVADPFLRAGTFTITGSYVVTNLVANGKFTTPDLNQAQGSLDGWQTYLLPNSTGGSHGAWGLWTGTQSPLSQTAVHAPLGSPYGAMLDEENLQPLPPAFTKLPNPNKNNSYEGTSALYQDIYIPTGAFGASLSLTLYINDSAANGLATAGTYFSYASGTTPNQALDYTQSVDNQQVRVDLMDPTGSLLGVDAAHGVLRNEFITNPNDPKTGLPVQLLTITDSDLTKYAGKTVRLRVATTNNRGLMIVGVSNVSLVAKYPDTSAPTVMDLGLRNPGVVDAGVPSTTDPTIVGRAAAIGGVHNLAFVRFDLVNVVTGVQSHFETTYFDAVGNFSDTFQGLQAGFYNTTITVQDKAANQNVSHLTFDYLTAGSNIDWSAVGPAGINVVSQPQLSLNKNAIFGRVTTVVVDPSDPTGDTYYIGTTNGGVWKTTDAGADWAPLTDHVSDAAGNPVATPIGGLVVSHPDPVAIGTSTLNLATVPGVSVADVAVQADVTLPLTGSGEADVLARYAGAATGSPDQNYYEASIVASNGTFTAQLSKNVNGTVTVLTSTALTGNNTGTLLSNGLATLKLVVSGNSLSLSIDGTQFLSATDGALTAAGAVGMRGTSGVDFGNFSAATTASPPVTLFHDGFAQGNGMPLTSSWQTLLGAFVQNTTVVYAGTGVGDLNFDTYPGSGVLKSIDGGATWTVVGNSETVLGGARITRMAVDDNSPNIVYAAVASGGQSGPGVYRSLDGGRTWVNVLTQSAMHLAPVNGGGTVSASTTLASVTDLIVDPFNGSRVIVGLGNIGLTAASKTAGVWLSTNQGSSWTQIVGDDNPNIPAATDLLPNNSTSIGRVTVAIGTGRAGDEGIVYVLVGTPPGNNTAPSFDNGSFSGLYKTSDNLLDFTKVMLREDTPTSVGGTPPIGPKPPHNFLDINLLGLEASNTGALVVDPSDPNVVYVGGSTQYPAANGQSVQVTLPTGGTEIVDTNYLDHAMVRIDTGDMRDTNYTDPSTGKIPNDGDDIQKMLAAEAQTSFEYYNGKTTDKYTGEGVSWYDIGQGVYDSTNLTLPNQLLPSNIYSLAVDPHGRLLIGSGGGLFRVVSSGYGYDYSSGSSTANPKIGLLGLLQGMTAPPVNVTITSVSGNLQIAEETSVAIDPTQPGVYYASLVGGGSAASTGLRSANGNSSTHGPKSRRSRPTAARASNRPAAARASRRRTTPPATSPPSPSTRIRSMTPPATRTSTRCSTAPTRSTSPRPAARSGTRLAGPSRPTAGCSRPWPSPSPRTASSTPATTWARSSSRRTRAQTTGR